MKGVGEVGNLRDKGLFNRVLVPEMMMLQTVRAVGHLHALGLVHGDVSLSNLLLTAEGDVKLADFGAVTGIHVRFSEELQWCRCCHWCPHSIWRGITMVSVPSLISMFDLAWNYIGFGAVTGVHVRFSSGFRCRHWCPCSI